jgi:DNA-binding response OmpR family regulator
MPASQKQLLLIDDNSLNAEALEALLASRNAGYAVECVAQLADGLKALETGNFDLVLLDLALPDSAGFETVRKTVKAVQKHSPKTAIILLTGNTDEELALRAIRAGVQDYLCKLTLEPQQLDRAIRYALERARSHYLLKQARYKLETELRARTVELKDALERIASMKEQERRRAAKKWRYRLGPGLEFLQQMLKDSSGAESAKYLKWQHSRAYLVAKGLADQLRRLEEESQEEAAEAPDLFSAIISHLHDFRAQTNISVSFQQDGIELLEQHPEASVAAFGIIQDVLNYFAALNSTPQLDVALICSAERLSLLITENGDKGVCGGKSLKKLEQELSIISRRASLVGGESRVQTSRQGHLTIAAHLPLAQAVRL